MRFARTALVLLALGVRVYAADEPTIKFGAVIYADFTAQSEPSTVDADGNEIHPSSFNVSRAYINVTGTLNKYVAFRITPDVARESGTGSSLLGSQNFRLKYAYAQLNLDDWMTRGTWVRFGAQQTPYLDFQEGIYRYRFQGTMFPEREGYITSSDAGLAMRYVFPSDYGEVHGGFYNGEGYSRAEANDEKAFQVRATFRPAPKATSAVKGLRAHVFLDSDNYISDAKRDRLFGTLTFEHKRVNAGLDVIATKDRTSRTKPELEGRGWGLWATPRIGSKGWELLLRHDHNKPDRVANVARKRNITGVAYWLPNLQKVTTAVMLDRDSLDVTGKPRETKWGLKLLLTF